MIYTLVDTLTAGLPRRSIFTPASRRVRVDNFENYWAYSQQHGGAILEDEKNLVVKKEILA